MIRILIGLCLFGATATLATAQTKVPDAFVVDADDLWQWKPFKKGPCTDCDGRNRVAKVPSSAGCQFCAFAAKAGIDCPLCAGSDSTCRSCAGSGKRTKDPLRFLACPQCRTTKRFPCAFCRGAGKVRVEGGSPKGNNCFCCAGKGHVSLLSLQGQGDTFRCPR